MNVFDLLEPRSRDIAASHLAAEDEQPYEVHAVKRDGTVFPVEIQARNITWQSRVRLDNDNHWRVVSYYIN